MQEYTISNQEKGQRLDKYLHRQMPEAPSSFFYKMLRKKNITRNGKKAAGNELLEEGDCIRIFLSDETFQKMGGLLRRRPEEAVGRESKEGGAQRARDKNGTGSVRVSRETARLQEGLAAYEKLSRQYHRLSLVYEDEAIAAAYKPAGVLSQKAEPSDVSLNEWFLGLLAKRGDVTEESLRIFVPSVQNRLDRNTEGLVLLARTLPGSHLLTSLQRQHQLRKFYQMVVFGRVEEGGVLEGFLEKNSAANHVLIHEKKEEGGVYAKTVYRPLAAGSAAKSPVTLLEAELITGRTHQLRAQLAAAGHPILGDPKYGDLSRNQELRRLGIHTQLLICARVEFPELDGEFASLSRKVITCKRPSVYDRVLQAPKHTGTR